MTDQNLQYAFKHALKALKHPGPRWEGALDAPRVPMVEYKGEATGGAWPT